MSFFIIYVSRYSINTIISINININIRQRSLAIGSGCNLWLSSFYVVFQITEYFFICY